MIPQIICFSSDWLIIYDHIFVFLTTTGSTLVSRVLIPYVDGHGFKPWLGSAQDLKIDNRQ